MRDTKKNPKLGGLGLFSVLPQALGFLHDEVGRSRGLQWAALICVKAELECHWEVAELCGPGRPKFLGNRGWVRGHWHDQGGVHFP